MLCSDHRHGFGAGATLRAARESLGLSVEQVAATLHMTMDSVARLEADDWSSLSASVFVRGKLRSYARLLGVDIEPYMEQVPIAETTPSVLFSHAPASSERLALVTQGAAYAVIVAVIVTAALLGAGSRHDGADRVQSLETSAAAAASAERCARPGSLQSH